MTDGPSDGVTVIRASDDGVAPTKTIDEICEMFRDQIHKVADTTDVPVFDPATFLVMTQIVTRLDRMIELWKKSAPSLDWPHE